MTTSGRFFLFAASVAILDQLVKFIIKKLVSTKIDVIAGFLSIVNVVNHGGGFGILQEYKIFLIATTLFFFYLVYRYFKSLEKNQIIPMALVTGGAVGNLIDRIFMGGVTDYINFSFWPAFNIADMAITCGVTWLIIVQIKKKQK